MKRNNIHTAVLAALLILAGKAQAQNGIERALKDIETNNKELQANAQLVTSQKLEARTDNNLPDPTLSYSHTWSKYDKNETIGELIVSQSFDFPSLYATRGKLNRLKQDTYDSQRALFRQDKLLQAKEVCLDIILLRKQKRILDERLDNARSLSELYAKRLATGDANTLETNKINLELLNVRTEAKLNEAALRSKQEELAALNGNLPIDFTEEQYPDVPFPTDYQMLKAEAMAANRTVNALAGESLAAQKQIAVSKSQWLPKLELGYRRNTETGVPFNGIVVGFSFPLFENRHKVGIAKAQALSIDLQKDNATLQAESELNRLYLEARSLQASMEEYRQTFRSQQNLELLKKALTGGQINMIEYFVEVSTIYQSHQNYLQLENQYQKAMAEIYKYRL